MLVILYDTKVIVSDNKTEIISIKEGYTVKQDLINGSYITCIKVNEHVILELCSNNFCLIDRRT